MQRSIQALPQRFKNGTDNQTNMVVATIKKAATEKFMLKAGRKLKNRR